MGFPFWHPQWPVVCNGAAPRLIALVLPGDVGSVQLLRSSNAIQVLGSTATLLRNGFVNVWQLVKPQASLVISIALTLLLALAASTINRSSEKKARNNSEQ